MKEAAVFRLLNPKRQLPEWSQIIVFFERVSRLRILHCWDLGLSRLRYLGHCHIHNQNKVFPFFCIAAGADPKQPF